MGNKECIAMVLAGGQGSRLGTLTQELAKPAVPFGGQYRIIDFTLSNCYNSGIDTVGILTQYQPLELHAYVGIGSAWDLDRRDGGVHILPPYSKEKGAEWYKGTADALYQNLEFMEHFDPEYVAILSGDHIYKMDYYSMLEYHKLKKADATIGVIEVPRSEAKRFGIVEADSCGRVVEFNEKPQQPRSNRASMGVYIFTWEVLKQYLMYDAANAVSSHDFGRDILPNLLTAGSRLYAYNFMGYWKDVGTIESYWEASMDLLTDEPALILDEPDWPIYSNNCSQTPHFQGAAAKVTRSLISGGALILGEVKNSVIFPGVCIEAGAKVYNAVVMQNSNIESGAVVQNAIVKQNANISPVMTANDNSIISVNRTRQTEQTEEQRPVYRAG